MRKNSIVLGTLILTFSITITRLIGFIFRIYLANSLGSEGMGLHQLILSVYGFMATIATSGIRTAVSKVMAEQIALNNYQNAKKTLNQSIFLSLLTGLIASFIMYFSTNYVTENIIHDQRAVKALLYLIPSLPVIAISSCYKGYFYAVGKVSKPAVVQILEQLVRIAVIVYLMDSYLPKGIDYACAAISIGVSAEEIFCLFTTWLLYIFDKKPKNKRQNKNIKQKNMMYDILSVAVPISATSYMNSALRTVENALIPNRLILYGITAETAMSLYGMIKGMVMPLLFFPSSFLSSLASLLIPSVAGDNARSNERKVTKTLSHVLHFTSLSSILTVCIFITFPNEISMAIYNDPQTGLMLKILSFMCPFMYLNMVVSSMLNALGEQFSSFKVNIIESILKISIIYFLMPKYGFTAYLIALFLTTILNTILYLIRLLQISCIVFDISNWIFKPILAAVISSLLARFIFELFVRNSSHNIISLISSGIILSLLYLMGLIASKSIYFSTVRKLKLK